MSQVLIIIDLIEDIIGEQGLSNSSAAETKTRDIINKSNKTAQYARAHQIPVIWLRWAFLMIITIFPQARLCLKTHRNWEL